MKHIFYGALVLILSVALGYCLLIRRQDRQQLESLNTANQFLRKTLGDMAIAITAKDREMERLSSMPCESPKKLNQGPGQNGERPAGGQALLEGAK